jgi:DNA-binding beta-propeller fold protein YncE
VASIPGSPFQVQKGTSLLAINPAGKFLAGALLYANFASPSLRSGGIQGELLDPSIGAVTGTVASPVQGLLSSLAPSAIAFHPSGNFVVAAYPTNQIAVYAVGSNGILTSVGAPVASGETPSALAFDPAGRFLLVANTGADSLSVYSFGTGVISLLGASAHTGTSPVAVAVSTSGNFVLTANQNDNTVSVFRFADSGTLTPLASVTAGVAPIDLIAVHF